MKNLYILVLILSCYLIRANAQDVTGEGYTCLKVTGANVPVIDGTIDPIWNSVKLVKLTKTPLKGGEEDPQLTVQHPDSTDLYSDLGMLWNNEGIFFRFKVVDDKVVIYEDYYLDNSVAADKWWWDDNNNILMSKDLVNAEFTQYEFSWQMGINQEQKMSSSDWAPPAQIDANLVKSAWWHDSKTTWILETFISWDAFNDGNANVSAGMDIYLEAAARDDDDADVEDDPYEAMLQWSCNSGNVQNDGIGMGKVTLSNVEVQPATFIDQVSESAATSVFPNPSDGNSELTLILSSQCDVNVSVYSLNGKLINTEVYENKPAGRNKLTLQLESLEQGMYFLNVKAGSKSEMLKFIRL
jgi:hypothetical protein